MIMVKKHGMIYVLLVAVLLVAVQSIWANGQKEKTDAAVTPVTTVRYTLWDAEPASGLPEGGGQFHEEEPGHQN